MILPNRFKIIVKAGSKESSIEGFDETKQSYKVSVKAKPENNKANIEIIRLIAKETKKTVRIISGLKSKQKIIELS